MSIQVFEAIAREADRSSAELKTLARQLGTFGERAVEAIGGTATGEDRVMLGLASQAMQQARLAAASFAEAAELARRAARKEAQREQEVSRRRSGGR